MRSPPTGLTVSYSCCCPNRPFGAYAVAIDHERAAPVATASTQGTSTVTIAPFTLPTSRAVPMITGSAPLRSERQGLPGDN